MLRGQNEGSRPEGGARAQGLPGVQPPADKVRGGLLKGPAGHHWSGQGLAEELVLCVVGPASPANPSAPPDRQEKLMRLEGGGPGDPRARSGLGPELVSGSSRRWATHPPFTCPAAGGDSGFECHGKWRPAEGTGLRLPVYPRRGFQQRVHVPCQKGPPEPVISGWCPAHLGGAGGAELTGARKAEALECRHPKLSWSAGSLRPSRAACPGSSGHAFLCTCCPLCPQPTVH